MKRKLFSRILAAALAILMIIPTSGLNAIVAFAEENSDYELEISDEFDSEDVIDEDAIISDEFEETSDEWNDSEETAEESFDEEDEAAADSKIEGVVNINAKQLYVTPISASYSFSGSDASKEYYPFIKFDNKSYAELADVQGNYGLSYKFKPSTSGAKIINLWPGKDYTVGFFEEHNTSATPVYEFSFSTPKILMSENLSNISWTSADVSFNLDETLKKCVKDTDCNYIPVDCIVSEVGNPENTVLKTSRYLNIFSETDKFSLANLTDGTEYKVLVCMRKNITWGELLIDDPVYTFTFTTLKDDRKFDADIAPSYSKASITFSLSDSIEDVETMYYFFYRKKGEENWQNRRASRKLAAFTDTFSIDNLEADTEYECVAAIADTWNYNSPDEISDRYKKSYTMIAKPDPRTVSAAVNVGYETAGFKITFENNTDYNGTFVHLFYKKHDEGDADWKEYAMHHDYENQSYSATNTYYLTDNDSRYVFVLKNLEQDVKYDYRVILNGKKDGTTALDEVLPTLKYDGSFTTKKCGYKINIKAEENVSTYKKEYLTASLTGSNEDSHVYADITFENDMDFSDTKSIDLFRDEKYETVFSLDKLSSDTKYYVTAYNLSVYENKEFVSILYVEPEEEISFTTKKALIPTKFELSEEEVFLNAEQPGELNVGEIIPKVIVNEGAGDEVIWSSDNESIATVDKDGRIKAVEVGECTVTATSVYDATIKAEIKVNVARVKAFCDGVETYDIAGNKNEKSGVMTIKYFNGDTFEDTDITSFDSFRPSVADLDEESGCLKFGAVGRTDVFFFMENYKVKVATEVTFDRTGFYISGFGNENYPGVKEDDYFILAKDNDYEVKLTSIDGTAIDAVNEFTFEFAESTESTPVVSIVDGKASFTAEVVNTKKITLTVTPKENGLYAGAEPATADIYIKELPKAFETGKVHQTSGNPILYILTSEDKVLKDVELNNDGVERKWADETITLYDLPKTGRYTFECCYAGDDKYPLHQNIDIYLGEITSFTIKDESKTGYIVAAGEKEKQLISLEFTYIGRVDPNGTNLQFDNAVNVNIECTKADKDSNNVYVKRVYEISDTMGIERSVALNAGVYSSYYEKYIKKATVNMNFTKGSVARSFKIYYTNEDDVEKKVLEESKKTLTYDATFDLKKNVNLRAEAYDYLKNIIEDASVEWSSSDTSVVKVAPASKTDTLGAVLTIVGEGNAIITVKSTDKAQKTETFRVEVKNIAPRVNPSKVSVNTALDYTTGEGKDIAYKFCGFVEVVEAYGNEIKEWHFYQKSQKTFEKEEEKGLKPTDFDFTERMGEGRTRNIIAMPLPSNPDMKNGTYNCWLVVSAGEEGDIRDYAYPITIKVSSKKIKVTAKSDTVNTFYMLSNDGDIAYTFKGDYINNPEINWFDNSEEAGGFDIQKSVYYNDTKKKWCSAIGTENLAMDGRKIASGVDTGVLQVVFKGYREPIEFKKFKIKNKFTVPNIVSVASKTGVSTDCGIDYNSFYLYDKTNKGRVTYSFNESKLGYSFYKSNLEEVLIEPTSDNSEYIRYYYRSEKSSEKLVVTLRSEYWREKVDVKHQIKNLPAKLVLDKTSMTFNKKLSGADVTSFAVKGARSGAILKEMKIAGKSKEAQKLLDVNALTFVMNEKKEIYVTLSRLEAVNYNVKAGTYSYNVTPVYISQKTGKEVTGKGCVLKVKIVDKTPTVKVKTKGSIDIAKYPVSTRWYEFNKNSIKFTQTFANVNSNYEIVDRQLVGDYSNYFDTEYYVYDGNWYIRINPDQMGKLKAGFTYRLRIKYVLKMKDSVDNDGNSKNDGVYTDVYSKVIKIKVKQSSPKVSITDNNQIFYISNEGLSRTYGAKLSSSYYEFESLTGSLDVNKDGIDDFVIENKEYNGQTMKFKVIMKDRDAVNTVAKGKVYTIPVEFMVKGADGVTKNVKSSIKVTVRR